MEFYFTDRQYNLLGIASTERGRFRIAGEVEAQSTTASTVALTGNVYFAKKDLNDAINMCVGEGGNYILYEDDRGVGHFMTIQNTQVDNAGCSINFQADDAGNDLKNEIVGAYTATKAMTFVQYFALFCADSGWEIGINEIPSNTRTLEFTSEQSSYDRILEVANDFGVSIYYSFEIDGLEPVHRYLNVVNRLGSDTNVTLRQGTDISQIVSETSTAELHTSIKAYGATLDGASQPLNLAGYKWTDSDGRYVLGGDGVLRDTVAIRTWSRLRNNSNPTPETSHLQMVKSYDANTQATLLQSALADLKTYNHPAVNYTVTMARVPAEVSKGDTVYCEDEAQDLYFSATVLEVDKCYSIPTASTLTLGDFKIEHDQTSTRIKQVADQLKTLEQTANWYPWTRYADDEQGTGISSLPLGKAYMAVVWGKTATPSDDAADYAGHWQKVKGDDGIGVVGPKGDDGKTSYFHTAYADSVTGSGLSQSPDGKKYIGTYSDFTEADSVTASDYTWVLIKGADGAAGAPGAKGDTGATGATGPAGPAGKDITSYASGAVLPTTVAPANSQFWVTNSNNVATALYKSNGTTWVKQEISASAINAATFNGLTFNGVIFNGSQFNSTFTSKPVDESSFDDIDDPIGQAMLTKGTGTTKMGDGYLTVDGSIDGSGTNGTPLQSFHTEVGASGLLSRLYTGGTDYSHVTAEARLNLGELSLTNLDTAGKARSGHLNGELLEQLNNVGKILWSGTSYLGYKGDPQSVKPSMKISDCLTGWKLVFGAFANNQFSGNQLREADISKTSVAAYPGMGRVIGLIDYNMQVAYKYIYVTDGEIKGNENNADGVKGQVVLIAIYAY